MLFPHWFVVAQNVYKTLFNIEKSTKLFFGESIRPFLTDLHNTW